MKEEIDELQEINREKLEAFKTMLNELNKLDINKSNNLTQEAIDNNSSKSFKEKFSRIKKKLF